MLEVNDLTVRYGGSTVVDRVSFKVPEGRWLMIVGPNGAGKSTILKAVSMVTPYEGKLLLSGEEIKSFSPRRLAREIGVLNQNHFVNYRFTVEEIVNMGRYSHSSGIFSRGNASDPAAVETALKMTGLLEKRNHSILTLSGGELQRTFLAQVFAQEPKLLLLDEPTNHLDLIYQKQVFDLIAEWVSVPGRAVVSVVHDLSLAKAYGTDALLMHRGNCIACDEIGRVLPSSGLNEVYGMDVAGWMRGLFDAWTV